jgi:hypothetical protein
MKKKLIIINLLFIAFILSMQVIFPADHYQQHIEGNCNYQGDDTIQVLSFPGKVIDKNTGDPIVFASVFITGTKSGTVTNSDGEFIIKIPRSYLNRQIGIAHLGYITSTFDVTELKPSENVIELVPAPYEIEEVTIRQLDPLALIRSAIEKIPENFSDQPVMMTSFYRETIKQNRNYVAIAEAVLDAYKASYKNPTDFDRIKVFKGRKSQDVKKMDTVLFKFQGGPYTSFLLDVAKNPGELLTEESFKFYNYEMGGIVRIHDAQAYVINFDQKEEIDFPLYKGKIYLDVDNLALVSVDFEISPKKIERASEYLIRKKPLGMSIDVESGNYLVNYRKIDSLWYLNYVRTELVFGVRWKRKLFGSIYTTMSEMAVTDISSENIEKYKYRETIKLSDVFVEKVTDFEDPDFWGDYNIIKPDESIEEAIEKLSRKLRRRTE